MKHIQMEDLQVSINLKKENKNLIYKMIPLRSEIEEVVSLREILVLVIRKKQP